MKTAIKFLLAAALLAAFLTVASHLRADEAAPAVATAATPAATDDFAALVAGFAANYPWLVTVLAIVGALRAVAKPLLDAYAAYVAGTPDTADDDRLAHWKASWWFRALAWLLDYTASIKVGGGAK